MSRRLGVGLVGCGRIAELVHLEVLTGLPDVDLVAVADADPERLEAAARRARAARAVGGYEDLLELPEVEAVVICAPSGLHAEVAGAALARGKHVYLEKPLATALEDGRELVTAWKRAGVVGMVGFNCRFHELYRAAREHVEAERLGALVAARSVFCSAPRELPAWKRRRESGGGALLDLASHHVDLVRFLLGQEVRDVFATFRSQRTEDDTAVLELRLEDGLHVQSLFSLGAVDEDRFEVYGEQAKLVVDRYRSLNVELTRPGGRQSRSRRVAGGLRGLLGSPYLADALVAPAREPSYRAALARFAAAARSGAPAGPDFLDGFRALAVIAAAEESAMTGRVVSPAEHAVEDPAR